MCHLIIHFYKQNSMTISSARLRTLFLVLLALFVIPMIGAAGWAPRHAYAQDGGQGEPVGKAYRGQMLFEQRCAQCHGEQGDGNSPLADQLPGTLPDFTAPDYAADMSPQEIFDIITLGRMDKMMPSWGDQLSENERWDLTAFVWSRHLPQATIDEAVKLYEAQCTECHGSSGAGLKEGVPDLTTPKWLNATDAELTAAFTNAPHPDTEQLSQDDQQLLATAVRRFSLGFDQTQVSVEGLGDVEVSVVNGSTGEHLANQPVRLIIFEQEQFAEMREGETDEQGRTQFTGLPTAPTWAYVVETTYQDLTYHSEVGHFAPDSNMIELIVPVYDAGATVDAVSIDRAHWLIDITNPSFIDVGEVYSFLNSADRVYAGEQNPGEDKPQVLKIPLPENAIHINVEGEQLGDRFILDGTTLIDTRPLPPGNTQIFLRYSLPVEKGEVTLAHQVMYPTTMLNLLAPDIGISIDAPDWKEDDPIQTQGGAFLNYTIFDLPAGARPAAVISDINEETLAAGATGSEPQQIIDRNAAPGISGIPYLPWIILGMGLVVLGGGVFIGWKRHKQTLADRPALLEEQRKTLITQMAALDDAYEAGEIPADDYHKQRNTLKLQIIALMREESGDQEAEEQSPNIGERPKIHPEEEPQEASGEENDGGATD
jgi:mono/diheme cytochrome c family protein